MPAPAARPHLAPSSLLLALVLACSGGPASTTETTDTATSAASTASTSTASTTSTATSTATAETTDTGVGPTSTTTGGLTTIGDTTTGPPAETSTLGDTTNGTTAGDTTNGTTNGDTTNGATTGDTTNGTTAGEGELGVIAGDCGLIDAMELTSPQPFVFTGAIDFGVVGYDYDLLTPGGQQIYDEGNLNPGSLYSEIVAYEVLARCDMAILLKTEAAIVYNDPMGKKTDFLAEIDGLKVGVSVVRAVGFPKDAPYTVAQAETILNDKLGDILISSANVTPEDAWVKQILSVVAYGPMHLDSLLTAYAGLDPNVKADTVLVITVTDGDDAFIYN